MGAVPRTVVYHLLSIYHISAENLLLCLLDHSNSWLALSEVKYTLFCMPAKKHGAQPSDDQEMLANRPPKTSKLSITHLIAVHDTCTLHQCRYYLL